MKYFLAIDLGASSGRHIVGYQKNGQIILKEVHRFKTGMSDSPFGLIWDIERFYEEILLGIKKAFKKYRLIESLSIDTWGVDYVLMNGEKEIFPCYAYRNERNQKSAEKVHKIVKFSDIYQKTGIQFAAFNSIYQLYEDKEEGRLDTATDYLMLPSYFIYKLTGMKTHEFTDESTGALLDAHTGEYCFDLIDKLGLPRKLFDNIHKPGYVVGELTKEVQAKVGGNCKVILCASHDTASAFESIDVPNDGIILSSGTWSLLGKKSNSPVISEESLKANYTNEGGIGYTRLLKNIMGMWISNELRTECNLTQAEINEGVWNSKYEDTFNVNDPSLLAPASMKSAVLGLLKKNPPNNDMDLFSSIYKSMAKAYSAAIEELEKITDEKYRSIYVIGGGAGNAFLNKMIEEYTGLKVVAMPIEATALGNIKVQMKGI